MSFKLCNECKKRLRADREVFHSTTICGTCYEAREQFLLDTMNGLREAFLFYGGNLSGWELGRILEKWELDK